ncbi:MAG: carboxypeptidase regulatory-like domain-containing protein [Planctomycetes bacterium]|nr:carboxypeptidase regulatory-like domain-containing protein [Planctomycetota bacterium]
MTAVIAGCESPVPGPADGGGSTKTDIAAPTDSGPVAVASIQQDDVLARLAQIEKLVTQAIDSPVFAEPDAQAAPDDVDGRKERGDLMEKNSAAEKAYKVARVSDAGTITGKVTYEGEAQPAKVFKVEKNLEACGKGDRVLEVTRVNDGMLADVVLVLKGVKSGKQFQNLVLSGPSPGKRSDKGKGTDGFQGTDIIVEGCTYGPLTGVIADGAELRFVNKDPVKYGPIIYYQVNFRGRGRYKNQALPPHGKLNVPIKFKSRSRSKYPNIIKLECDQYPHMQNWFYRVDNPYYAFSGRDGTFTIDGVPPGRYKLIAWHPMLGEQDQEVTVAANGTADVTFKFSSKKRRR